jgi:hypothetical protein
MPLIAQAPTERVILGLMTLGKLPVPPFQTPKG